MKRGDEENIDYYVLPFRPQALQITAAISAFHYTIFFLISLQCLFSVLCFILFCLLCASWVKAMKDVIYYDFNFSSLPSSGTALSIRCISKNVFPYLFMHLHSMVGHIANLMDDLWIFIFNRLQLFKGQIPNFLLKLFQFFSPKFATL